MPDEREDLTRQRDYLATRLEENARELARLDLQNLALSQQQRQARTALSFVRVSQSRAFAATAPGELYDGVVETISQELGVDGAAVLRCNWVARTVAVLAASGMPGDLVDQPLPAAVSLDQLVAPSYANSTTAPSEWRAYVATLTGCPHFIWCPVLKEAGQVTVAVAANQSEDPIVRPPLGEETLGILTSLAALVRLRLEDLASTERVLGEREQRIHYLAEILRTSPIAVLATSEQGRIEYVSPAAALLYGYRVEEMIGRSPSMLNAEPDADRIERDILETLHAGGVWQGELRNRRADGQILHIRASMYRLLDSDGQVLSLVGFQQDISDEVRARESLRQSEERYRDLFENASDLIQSVDSEGRFLYVNRAWMDTLGYTSEEVPHLRLPDILRPDQIPHCLEMLECVSRGQAVQSVQTVFVARDGRQVPVEGSANAHLEDGEFIATRGIFRDITERRRLEAQQARAQKLESLGVLAGGIAHDFNNLLTGILGNISLVERYMESGRPVAQALKQADAACRRARDLTQQLLTFSKGGAPVRRAMHLQRALRQAASFAARGTGVSCECIVDEALWPVEADEGQISQVISNLVINAIQSEPGDQTVRVRADNVDLGGGDGRLPAGRYIRVAVDDRGCGIPAASLERIFDPYFTTKQGGSGLGLATAHSIVRQHEGHLEVESQEGAGTTMRFYLPASDEEVEALADAESTALAGAGRVLVMDDEPTVRAPAVAMLEYAGYRVAQASDGAAAARVYQQALEENDRFDVAVLDLTVAGGMGGAECLAALRRLDPGVRAIVCSGYSKDPVMARHAEYGFAGVLAKPFDLEGLVGVVGEVLAGGSSREV